MLLAYKLLDTAEDRWRKINSSGLVALIRAGVDLRDGIQAERRTDGSRNAA